MDGDSAAKLLMAIAKILGVVVWPAVIWYILIRFRSNIGEFISNLGEMTLKGGGFEASVKRRQSEALAALLGATLSRMEDGANAARAAAEAVGEINANRLRRMAGAELLWVDDMPDNNKYEMQALEAFGIKFILSTSTDDAMTKTKERHFSAIISDMSRPSDAQAGYTLLEKLQSSGNKVPFIIYARSHSPDLKAEAIRRGALGYTNDASELFELVVFALMLG